MTIGDSNTYVEPTAGTSLNTARQQQNRSYRAILGNFASPIVPAGVNLVADDAQIGEQTGMLWQNTSVHALYVSDSEISIEQIGSSNFTRRGLGFRTESTIVNLGTNTAAYEIGETCHVIINGGTEANSRIYLKYSNADSGTSGWTDIGTSPPNSVTTSQIQDSAITSNKIFLYGSGDATINGVNIDTGGDGSRTLVHTLNLFGNVTTKTGNVGIVFNASNAISNVGLKVYQSVAGDSLTGVQSGLIVTANTGVDFAPIGANVILQSTTGANAATDTASSKTLAPLVPVGSIIMWGTASAPDGWLLCDGSTISRTTYGGLFGAIGTGYGVGDGSSTFKIPDFKDRIPLGKGSNNSTLNDAQTGASASGVVATATGTAGITTGDASFASSAKDSSTATAITSVSAGGHTHNLTLPSIVITYIIKT